MAYEKLNLKTGDRFEAEHVGHIETALAEVVSSDETKAPQTTLDARVPDNLGLRIDTSVGTRIFAGTTMIYGDTGWRDVTSLITPAWPTGNVFVRRVNERVYLKLNASSPPVDVIFNLDLTVAWRSDSNTAMVVNIDSGRITINWNGSFAFRRTASGSALAMHEFYITNAPWPVTLPGTPA